MTPDTQAQKTAQAILNDRDKAGLEVDGYFGPKSIKAAKNFVPSWTFKGNPTRDRWIAAVIQIESVRRGINAGKVDAYFGPQTDDAGDRIAQDLLGVLPFGRPEEEVESPIIRCWNPSTSQFRQRYGAEGSGQGTVASPYPLKLDWDLDTVVHRFAAHESLTDRIEAAMKEVLAHYGIEGIIRLGLDRFGGCLNVRLKRGGSTPSVHSWGAALDWFPSVNMLRETKRTARFAREEYKAFMDIWERYGFMSLGRCFDFDWMHVQANP